jgi:NAD(P)-dependent dehydrogenase (short-subunit alcohol dehydrogenase family)
MDQTKRIAMVTGAGSGIGRATAIALAHNGWTIVLAGRRDKDLRETATLCGDGKTLILPTDIVDHDSVQLLFSKTKSTFGRLDLLFNNAGVSAPAKLLEDVSRKEWDRVINTNLTGTFLCLQEAFKIMKNQNPMGGRIINNGSISAHVPRPHSIPYAASKHAITGLTKSASLEGRAFNIAVGQIDIGNASSNMTKAMEKGILQSDGSRKIEPTINVNDVAQTIVYMANLPLNANVPFLTIMANQMPYMGRG